MKNAFLVCFGLLAASGSAYAQQPGTTQMPQAAATCVGCHGQKGEGNAASNFPRLSGQPQAYLEKQLHAYADGRRQNQIMMPIAKALTPAQMQEVSAYYAALDAQTAKTSPPSAQAAKRAAQLANVGDEKLFVQGCVNCHGPGGTGEPPLYPYLSGQHAGYLTAALNEWKSGARNTDPSMQMSTIAKRLSDEDIAALASYYAAQPAPVPEPQRTSVARGTPQRPVGPPAATSGGQTQPSTGTSVEQGEATTGGSQGPGGANTTNTGPSGSNTGR